MLDRKRFQELGAEARLMVKNSLPELLRGRGDVIYKPDNSPVSKSDVMMEKKLVDLFSRRFENLEIVSEEETTKQSTAPNDASLLVVIDPIDGTENFVSGLPEWGVTASFWSKGGHQYSFIYLPELDQFVDSITQVRRRSSRIHAFSSSMSGEILQLLSKNLENRITGCGAFNHLNVIEGKFSSYTNPKGAWVWDLLAGANIARFNGLNVKINGEEYGGQFLDVGRKHSFEIC